jgi:hypothetical protein
MKITALGALISLMVAVFGGCASSAGVGHEHKDCDSLKADNEAYLAEIGKLQLELYKLRRKHRKIRSKWSYVKTTIDRDPPTDMEGLTDKFRFLREWLSRDPFREGYSTGLQSGPPCRVSKVEGRQVHLPIGSDHGVIEGDVFVLFRRTGIFGQVRVYAVYPARSAGLFENVFGKLEEPRVGDLASARGW